MSDVHKLIKLRIYNVNMKIIEAIFLPRPSTLPKQNPPFNVLHSHIDLNSKPLGSL